MTLLSGQPGGHSRMLGDYRALCGVPWGSRMPALVSCVVTAFCVQANHMPMTFTSGDFSTETTISSQPERRGAGGLGFHAALHRHCLLLPPAGTPPPGACGASPAFLGPPQPRGIQNPQGSFQNPRGSFWTLKESRLREPYSTALGGLRLCPAVFSSCDLEPITSSH